jgi:hypothetical protein
MAWWSNAERLFESVIHLFTDLWNVFRSTVLWIFGDDKPEIPDSTVQRLLEAMLIEFNKGTVLSRANMVTFNNGDAMLSSVQMHRVGMVAFQKHPWAASLGLDACVWTTARWMAPTLESWKQSIIDFFVGLGSFHGSEAAASALAPLGTALGGGKDIFGHDGPNYWTGSLALPMIVQHENAAIIAYNVPAKQREFSGTQTHAWFPKDRFDETRKQDASDGTWFFGRKDTIDVDTAKKVGSGYVALFSAHRCDWTNEDGNAWNGKEILASGGSNIYVCMVGNEAEFGTFDVFVQKILAAHLNISGVGSANGLECTFDVPDKGRLELFYDDAKGRFDGEDLAVDEFPRFENRYVRSSRDGEVDWQSRKYQFVHSPTGLTVTHDLDRLDRVLTRQSDPGPKKRAGQRRLLDGSLTPVRRTSR